MPDRCVVFGCNKSNSKECREKGVSLHRIPYWSEDNPIAKRRRKQWVDFVSMKRAYFKPSKYSAVCNQHFTAEDFERPISTLPGFSGKLINTLRRDDVDIVAVPSIFIAPVESETGATAMSPRSKRRSRKHRMAVRSALERDQPQQEEVESVEVEEFGELDEIVGEYDAVSNVNLEPAHKDAACQTLDCMNCKRLVTKTRRLRNLWLAKQMEVKKLKVELNKING